MSNLSNNKSISPQSIGVIRQIMDEYDEALKALADNPEGWELTTIDKLGEIFSGGTPSRDNNLFWNGSIPWVTPTEITNLKGHYLTETKEYISNEGLRNSSANFLPINSLLMTSRATIGAIAIAAIPVTTNQGFKSLVLNKNNNYLYFYYYFQFIKSNFIKLASGSTFEEISKKDFSSIQVFRPPLPEQEKIGQILDTLDDVIAKTEAAIAKLKNIKMGLVHDLLTRGLDENGELRDPIKHPEQFKESSLGLIPKDWDYLKLKDICKTPIRDFGSFSMTNLITFLNSGIPFLKSEMIEEENVNTKDISYISDNVHQLLKKSWVYSNNILYSKIGSALGKATIYDGSLGICNSNAAIAKIDIDKNLAIPIFIVFVLNSVEAKERIKKSIISLLPRVNLTDLYAFCFALPKLSEQQKIVNILEFHKKKINLEEAYLEKLKLQKKGLMHDLLTGKKRVNHLL